MYSKPKFTAGLDKSQLKLEKVSFLIHFFSIKLYV